MLARKYTVALLAQDGGEGFDYDKIRNDRLHPMRTLDWKDSSILLNLSADESRSEELPRLTTMLKQVEQTLVNSLDTTVPSATAKDLAFWLDKC
jgi:hypothetical protein